MTGLEKILAQIESDAKSSANDMIKEAKEKADKIIQDANAESAKQASQILKQGEGKTADIKQRGASSALFEKRNKLLAFKQGYIDTCIKNVRASLENAPDGEYFENLLSLVSLYAKKENGVMYLNEKDLARMPQGFAAKVAAAAGHSITVSDTPRSIDSGFLLVYEGIDINCSFRAIFEDQEDTLRDLAGQILFPEA